MSVLTPADAVQHDLHGARFTAYLAPSRGSTQLCAWQLDVPADSAGLEHRVSHEEVLLVLDGTLDVSVDGVEGRAARGHVVHVPAGSRLRVGTGAEPASAWVTTTPRADGRVDGRDATRSTLGAVTTAQETGTAHSSGEFYEQEVAMSSAVKILLALVAIWVALGIVGLLIKGLFWLFVIALVAFGFTLARSATRRGILGRR